MLEKFKKNLLEQTRFKRLPGLRQTIEKRLLNVRGFSSQDFLFNCDKTTALVMDKSHRSFCHIDLTGQQEHPKLLRFSDLLSVIQYQGSQARMESKRKILLDREQKNMMAAGCQIALSRMDDDNQLSFCIHTTVKDFEELFFLIEADLTDKILQKRQKLLSEWFGYFNQMIAKADEAAENLVYKQALNAAKK